MKVLWICLRGAAAAWSRNEVPRLGAVVAFYTTITLAPLLWALLLLPNLFLDHDVVTGQLRWQLRQIIGDIPGKLVMDIGARVQTGRGAGVRLAIGFITSLWSSAAVFFELKNALNRVWDAPPRSASASSFFLTNLRAIGIVLAFGFVVMLLVVSGEFVSGFRSLFRPSLSPANWRALEFSLTLLIVCTAFAVILRYLPDAVVAWKTAWLGAGLASVLFLLGRIILALYLRTTRATSAYGAVESLVVLMLWIYFSVQSFLFGAEFARLYARLPSRSTAAPTNAATAAETESANPPQ